MWMLGDFKYKNHHLAIFDTVVVDYSTTKFMTRKNFPNKSNLDILNINISRKPFQ